MISLAVPPLFKSLDPPLIFQGATMVLATCFIQVAVAIVTDQGAIVILELPSYICSLQLLWYAHVR